MNKNICRLTGKKIYLSILRDDDWAVSKYIEWMSNEATALNMEKNNKIIDVSEMPGWCHDSTVSRMGIVYKDGDILIGYCHIEHRAKDMAAWLSINIGNSEYRGKHLGEDVMQVLIKYCFLELGVFSCHLDVLECNKAAIACYEKVGLKVTGRYRKHGFHNGKPHDWLHMDIIDTEFFEIYGEDGQGSNS